MARYSNTLEVTVGAGSSVSVPHGLTNPDGTGLTPDIIQPWSNTPLAVTAVDGTNVTFSNAASAVSLTARFRVEKTHSIQGAAADLATPSGVVYWQGAAGGGGGSAGYGASQSLFRLGALPRSSITGVSVQTTFGSTFQSIPAGLLNGIGRTLRVRMAVSLNDQYSFTGGILLGGTAIALISTFTPGASNLAFSVAEADLQVVTTGAAGQFTLSKWQITDGQQASGGVPGVISVGTAISGTYDLTGALTVAAYGTPGNNALTVVLNEFTGMYLP